MAAGSPPARPPGRPKDVTLDAAILAAAERHLGERGYAGMTIQGVAAAAGTSAPSLRRRYRDKLELALASIDAMQTQPLPEETADPRAGALAILDNLRVTMIRRNGLAILASIFAERARHPELLVHFSQRVEEPLRKRLRQALSAGVETGQLPASLDLDTAVSMLTGSLYAHYLSSQELPREWAEHTLRIIWAAGPSQPGYLSAPAAAQLCDLALAEHAGLLGARRTVGPPACRPALRRICLWPFGVASSPGWA